MATAKQTSARAAFKKMVSSKTTKSPAKAGSKITVKALTKTARNKK